MYFSIPERVSLESLRLTYILKVISDFNGNKTHAAKAMGIAYRTLKIILKRHRDRGEIGEINLHIICKRCGREKRVYAPNTKFCSDACRMLYSAANV